jgi:urocanate hydratase
MYALGVTMYGQMTAGSYCYIGPQGIVHGTTLTILNAGRKYLNLSDLSGKVMVTSGLGGMSGAQPKAGVICKIITVVAEVNESALDKRLNQGWVHEKEVDLDKLIARIKRAKEEKKPTSIAYLGNIVDLWERLAEEEEMLIELGSDQTSLHNPFGGGYYPVGYSFEESNKIMTQDPARFKELVQASLRRHVTAINKLCQKGMRFWDYGNSFLLESKRAQADILTPKGEFKYPSYVQDIMGDIFSLGFGPFRWVCTSGEDSDLELTDKIAQQIISRDLLPKSSERSKQQYQDNLLWIEEAGKHKLVVGSKARILYSDAIGRIEISLAFNEAIKDGRLKGPINLSRDHHDVSGTDSPYRETSNITDGSKFCADMAIQNCIGDSFRGATWVSIHNGGGTGWGEAINGGFGLVLDGSEDASKRAKNMLFWDVNNGVARRSWSGNENAEDTIKRAMELEPLLRVTIPEHAKDEVIDKLFAK